MGKTPSLPCVTMLSWSFIGRRFGIWVKTGSLLSFLVHIIEAGIWTIVEMEGRHGLVSEAPPCMLSAH